MERLKKIYRENIYGVIGTLAFHILIVSFLLLKGINIRSLLREDALVVNLNDMIQENTVMQKSDMSASDKEQLKGENPGTNEPSGSKLGENSRLLTNRGSNTNLGLAKTDRFFNEAYQKEISDARNLASKVNAQLKKEVIKIGDIKMPVEKTSGMNRDSIKNVVYSGESNIVYNLGNRYHLSLPIPVYLAQGGGNVIVDITVDREGSVVKATSRKNNRIADPQVFFYAELAASKTLFNPDRSAPEQQKGTIRYNFIAQ
jgi:hypothetical protein